MKQETIRVIAILILTLIICLCFIYSYIKNDIAQLLFLSILFVITSAFTAIGRALAEPKLTIVDLQQNSANRKITISDI